MRRGDWRDMAVVGLLLGALAASGAELEGPHEVYIQGSPEEAGGPVGKVLSARQKELARCALEKPVVHSARMPTEVRFVIDEAGKPQEVKVNTHSLDTACATKVVQGWRFAPGKRALRVNYHLHVRGHGVGDSPQEVRERAELAAFCESFRQALAKHDGDETSFLALSLFHRRALTERARQWSEHLLYGGKRVFFLRNLQEAAEELQTTFVCPELEAWVKRGKEEE